MSGGSRVSIVGLAFAVAMALAAVFAQAAGAKTWTDSSPLASGETRPAEASAMSTVLFKTKIGGEPVEVSATGLEAIGGEIIQEGSTAAVAAQVKFTGVSVIAPMHCIGAPVSITTNALKGELITASGLTSGLALKLIPKTGTSLATVSLGCITSFKVAGSFCAETNSLGIMESLQRLTFSSAIAASCGGELKVGGEAATLTGEATARLVSGLSWGAS